MGPLIETLKELGGSGTPSEVREKIAAGMDLSDDVLDEQLETGTSPTTRLSNFLFEGFLSVCHTTQHNVKEGGRRCYHAHDVTNTFTQ
ncbi:hypothetical protein ACFL2Q_14215, partial [Thermodesulfobacteriota bacterium]